tara:strand:- start:456 stop:944 length:489 start_codon:yes stop_codon:yes gene_type:complete
MTTIKYDIINSNNLGKLYNVSVCDGKKIKPIEIKLNNVKSIFGKEKKYNNYFIKWCINNNDISIVRLIESMLRTSFVDENITEVNSAVCIKQNYPNMLESKIVNTSSYDVITHEPGEIITYDDIKNKPCNVTLKLKSVNIPTSKKKLYYNLEIINIALLNNK